MKTSNTLTIALTLFAFNLTSAHNELDQPAELGIHILSVSAPTCNGGNDGFIHVEAAGGKAPYTYLWNTFPNQHTAKAEDLTAGVYFIYITDANDSTVSRSIEIMNPTKSSIIADNTIEAELKCTVSGLNAPYIIQVDGADLSGGNAQLPFDSGIHQIKIIDVNGCEAVQYIQLVESFSKEHAKEGVTQIIQKESIVTSQLIPVIIDPVSDFYNSQNLAVSEH